MAQCIYCIHMKISKGEYNPFYCKKHKIHVSDLNACDEGTEYAVTDKRMRKIKARLGLFKEPKPTVHVPQTKEDTTTSLVASSDYCTKTLQLTLGLMKDVEKSLDNIVDVWLRSGMKLEDIEESILACTRFVYASKRGQEEVIKNNVPDTKGWY